jgi:phosphate butyryltransferase
MHGLTKRKVIVHGKGTREMKKGFDELVAKVKECGMKKVAISVAQDSAVLEAVRAAKDRGIADAVLVGDEAKIKEIAAEIHVKIDDFEIINEPDMIQASLTAVKLAHDGKVDMYMKGLIDTKNFLKSVLDKEVGLRTGGPLSHVAVFDIPTLDKLLFLTDVAFMTYPTLEDKANIIKNTVPVCKACGIENPKVAPLAAVEVVNPKMPATVEAQQLTEMCENGEIKDCIVDGPLSLDLAIDPEAAKHKGATGRKIQGDADILLFPDIHAGNLVYKALVHTVPGVKNGCILTGTKVPVILTSRSDTFETKVNSIALAAVVAHELNK